MTLKNIKKESKDLVFIYTTCPDKKEAQLIGLSAVDNKLAISADYWLIESIYPWKGVIQQVSQYMLMLSSQKYLADQLIEFINKIHSYKTPMIVMSETSSVNYQYKFWMDGLLESKNKYLTKEEAQKKRLENGEGVYHYGKLK